MKKYNTFCFGKMLIVMSLSIFIGNATRAQREKCNYNINSDTIQSISIKPEILTGLKSAMISPHEFSTTKGMLLRCQFNLDNQALFADVTQYDYTFYREGHVYYSGIGFSAFWTDSLMQLSRTVKKGDSLTIRNITGIIKNADTSIVLDLLPAIRIENMKLIFSESAYIPTSEELLFNKNIQKLKGYEKLSDLYASGYRIDVSMVIIDVDCARPKQPCSKRYQFKSNHHIDFDFTFKQNAPGEIYEIYDHIQKKKYSLRQWERRMRKVKL